MTVEKYKKESKIPNSVCWNITSKCNDTCKFCYRDKNIQELSFEKQKQVIDQIAKSGIKKLTFAGGEPLLVENINQLVLYAKSKNLIVSMTTNGILLDDNKIERDFLLRNLNWLTLSLDGENDLTQAKMTRNTKHASRVKDILTYANKYEERTCKLKINTVVSQVNKNEIADIINIIKNYGVERWKLFQFSPIRGSAKESKETFEISDVDYKRITDEIQRELSGDKTIVSITNRESIEAAYFVVFPDGSIRISTQCQDDIVGNILTNDVREIWENNKYLKTSHEERTSFINKAF